MLHTHCTSLYLICIGISFNLSPCELHARIPAHVIQCDFHGHRFLFQHKSVYLLDDPLAAVDAHVAKHLFHECIMGLLCNRTRILCTHHTSFLKHADIILRLEDGIISQIGKWILHYFAWSDVTIDKTTPEYPLKIMSQMNYCTILSVLHHLGGDVELTIVPYRS